MKILLILLLAFYQPKPKVIMYGRATFYASMFNGRKTYTDEIYDPKKMTCACNKVPMHTWLKVTSIKTHKSVIVRVNDKLNKRVSTLVDLTPTAARKIGLIDGIMKVKVEIVQHP
jgi:rare lipoprotein A